MGIDFTYPEFEVQRKANCINCMKCISECTHGVHSYDERSGTLVADDTKCVNCQRCVCFCPVHALKIVRSGNCMRDNANWGESTVKEVYKQAASGGVLLSSMGNPNPAPCILGQDTHKCFAGHESPD